MTDRAPMKFSDNPAYILDAWALFEAFRRLGFASNDIYALVAKNAEHPDSGLWFGVTLRAQEKEFTALLMPTDNKEAVLSSWKTFAEQLAAGLFPQNEMQREWEERFIKRSPGPAALISGLLLKGFYLPLQKN